MAEAIQNHSILFVDLDNTLIRSDLSLEPLLRLIRRDPILIFLLPVWLLRGRTFLKQALVSRVLVDVTELPFDEDVLSLLKAEKADGKELVLATASHFIYAQQVAEHLGIFDGVIATENGQNTKGKTKLQAIKRYAGDRTFAYVGDSHADLAIWRAIGAAIVVRPQIGVLRRLKKLGITSELVSPSPSLQRYLTSLRPWQWLKNLLIFAPLILAKSLTDLTSLMACLLAFVCFSLCASAGYIVNDLLDLDADRQHPRKKKRPFVSGELPLWNGVYLALFCLVSGLLLSLCVSATLMLSLLLYFALVMAYSLEWKEHAILDVLLLAGFYTARLVSGAIAADVVLSFWLMAFAIFLFLSLGAVKRCTELRSVNYAAKMQIPGRGYTREDEPLLFSMGIASGYMSVVVIALYINSDEVKSLYLSPQVLWLVCPLMLYWISRMWLKTSRRQMHDDPIVFAMRDKVSLACAVLLLLLMMLASVA